MKRHVVALVLLLLSVPSVLALGEAISFYHHNATNGSIISSGIKRTYYLYVPASYDRAKPTPLVISMHAAALWSVQQMETSEWNRVADKYGFIVVYPDGTTTGGPRIWAPDDGPELMRDVLFISDLIDTLSAHYHIDVQRVYANGLSNGGGMSFMLSCLLWNRIAAVGLVASAQTRHFTSCHDDHAVPMIAFHGSADPVAKYHGGASWAFPKGFPDFPTFVSQWARRNGCTSSNDERAASDVIERTYTGCANDASVVFYTIVGGGHTWPGGGELAKWFVGRTS
jgi:polyhydroxybutyrate depolymerase